MENEIVDVKLDDIIPNRFQPREVFNEVALNELANSIKTHGLIQPIVVRSIENGKYEIIAGERRYKACILAGLTKIPVIVKQLDDKESSIVALLENSQRKEISAIEEAKAFKRILDANNMTQEELAKQIGLSQPALANKLRLLALPIEIQESLMKGEISERHARSLLSLKSAPVQIEMLNKIKENRMTVRDLDSEIKKMNGMTNNDNNTYTNSIGVENSDNQYIYPTDNNMFMPNDKETNNNQFINELSTIGMNNSITQPVETVMNQNNNSTPQSQDFMSFLNGYDTNYGNYSLNNDVEQTNNEMSNQSQNTNAPTEFENFLESFDPNKYAIDTGLSSNEVNNNQVNNDVQTDFYSQTTPTVMPENNDNLYNINAPLDNSQTNNSIVNDTPSFINNDNYYSNNRPIENSNFSSNETPLYNGINNNQSNNNDPIFNNINISQINPPITSFTDVKPAYVEDNPNYVSIDKPQSYDSIDAIIGELQITLNKIKNSKYKVDTEEINYDDVYEITIKINKTIGM